MMAVGYIFSAPFFVLTVKTSQKQGQKASLVKYTKLALAMYVGVLALLIMWKQGVPALTLSVLPFSSINLYTILLYCFSASAMEHIMQPQICPYLWWQTVPTTKHTVQENISQVSWEHYSH